MTKMEISLFEYTDIAILEPNIEPDSWSHKAKIKELANKICSRRSSDVIDTFTFSPVELNRIASLHCDTWLEETALHMALYAGASALPSLVTPSNNSPLENFKIARYRNYSGDVSGIIGEALFALLLTKYLKVDEIGFAHFTANKATGIFPDFGIYQIPQSLVEFFENAFYRPFGHIEKIHPDIIPAEVKAMANPDNQIVNERLDKAVRQIRKFWATRDKYVNTQLPVKRGPSIIFLALRDPERLAYDGVLIWLI